MPENTVSLTPVLDGILSKLPKEVLSTWLVYSKSRPLSYFHGEQKWKEYSHPLACLAMKRANDIPTIPYTIASSNLRNQASTEVSHVGEKLIMFNKLLNIATDMANLMHLEHNFGERRVKIKVLQAERSLGEDASKTLEQEIVRDQLMNLWNERWIRRYSDAVMAQGTKDGPFSQKPENRARARFLD
ncbi:MAG: hypothetical protein Q9169_007629 [Polycauliona sp. 2 TL-2023]